MTGTPSNHDFPADLTPREDRAVGALIGTFVGDALGMPVEGWSYRRIEQQHGAVDEMLDARLGKGTYTDDTQMMVATAKSLIEAGGIDLEHLVESYLEHFDPDRGYGQGTRTVFRKWRQGVDVREASGQVFDGGSFGNGGSMRIAPVGILYAGQPGKLKDAVRSACGLTHAHPLGIGSSFLQAYAVSKAFQDGGSSGVDPDEWVRDLLDHLPDDLDRNGVLSDQLETTRHLLKSEPTPADPGRIVQELGCTSRAFESAPTSLYAFLVNPSSFEEALVYSVGLGGDTDTIGAMTGAISGAYHGVSSVPERWWSVLENGKDGRDDIVRLGRALVERRQRDTGW